MRMGRSVTLHPPLHPLILSSALSLYLGMGSPSMGVQVPLLREGFAATLDVARVRSNESSVTRPAVCSFVDAHLVLSLENHVALTAS